MTGPARARFTPAASTGTSLGRRVWEVLRDGGPVALWFKVVGELGYRRLWIYETELARLTARPVRAACDFEWIDERSAVDFASLVPWATPETAGERLAEGQIGLLGRIDGRPVCSAWTALETVKIDYLGVRISMRRGAAYMYEVFVAPEARRLGLGWASTLIRARESRDRGCTDGVSLVMPENRPGVELTLSLGYRRVGTLRRLRLPGRT
ncbi:MAG: GNAT family N-acetyltransferase, partial [Thermoanaerobaculia bacterium]|nr:GNAT family N-acetyltransferase [Thermoanaerobaculia bacterium]